MADKFSVKSPVVLTVTTCVLLLVNLVTANIVDEMNGKSVEVVLLFLILLIDLNF